MENRAFPNTKLILTYAFGLISGIFKLSGMLSNPVVHDFIYALLFLGYSTVYSQTDTESNYNLFSSRRKV